MSKKSSTSIDLSPPITGKPFRKPRCGVLLLASIEFRNWRVGAASPDGDYAARLDRKHARMLSALGERFELINPGILYSNETGRIPAIKAAFEEQEIDFVFICFLSWTRDYAWFHWVRDMGDTPAIYCVYAEERIGWTDTLTEDRFAEFLVSSDLVGALEGSGSVPRNGKKTLVVAGDPSDESTLAKIEEFGIAAAGRSLMRKSVIGLMGGFNPEMWVTHVDPYRFFFDVGPEIRFLSFHDLKSAADAVPPADAEAYRASLRSRYHINPDADDRGFLETARVSLGLAQLLEDKNLDAIALYDFHPEIHDVVGVTAGFYPESINTRGAVIVPEADVGMTTIMLALKRMTGKVLHFVEPHYIDRERNRFLACHGGPNDHNLDDPALVVIAVDFRNRLKAKQFPAAPHAWVVVPPGPKTLVHFSQSRTGYKLIAFCAESLPHKHSIDGYAHSVFQPAMPICELFERIASIGSSQHFAAIEGDVRGLLARFAEIMNLEYYSL